MVNNKLNTEQTILNKAIAIFTKKGYNGVSMQMIADESENNKSLLHYYFRSKQQLFSKVFTEIVQDFVHTVGVVLEEDEPLLEKIPHLVKSLFSYGQSKPDYIYFLITEMKRDNKLILLFDSLLSVQLKKGILTFYYQVNEAVEVRKIKQIQPRELLETIFTNCFSEVVNKNFFEGIIGKNETKHNFLEEKIKIKTQFILSGIL